MEETIRTIGIIKAMHFSARLDSVWIGNRTSYYQYHRKLVGVLSVPQDAVHCR